MRGAFIRTLFDLAEKDTSVVLLTGDLGYKLFDDYRERFSGQFVNMGIAEANMVSVSVGLAIEGKKPFLYSLSTFLTMRAYEQIRNDICFHKAKVVLVGCGGGFSYGANGASHHALTDVALMRSLPEMKIFAPADCYEAEWAVRTAYYQEGPAFIRLGRTEPITVHNGSLEGGGIGSGIILHQGDDIAILVSGLILSEVQRAARELDRIGLSVRLISFPLIKPLQADLIFDALDQCDLVFTVEEHSVSGGFFSSVIELAIQSGKKVDKVRAIAVPHNTIHYAGSQEYLRRKMEIDCSGMVRQILRQIHANL